VTQHDLKIWPEGFEAIMAGAKTWEFRRFDRYYRVGDTLLLREWDPATKDYTGRTIRKKVTYLQDLTEFGAPRFVGMSLGDVVYDE
jgi:hypothetical protein